MLLTLLFLLPFLVLSALPPLGAEGSIEHIFSWEAGTAHFHGASYCAEARRKVSLRLCGGRVCRTESFLIMCCSFILGHSKAILEFA